MLPVRLPKQNIARMARIAGTDTRVLLRYAAYVARHSVRLAARVGAPAVRAFLFAYCYVILPKIVSTVAKLSRTSNHALILPRIWQTLRNALRGDKFPAMAARLLLGISTLEPLVFWTLRRARVVRSTRLNLVASTFVAAFASALATFPRFQSRMVKHHRHASLDVTLLVVTRALDTALAAALLDCGGAAYAAAGDAALFVASAALVMYAWFFHPGRLPPAYRKWITLAACMDDDVVDVLRGLHRGTLRYGDDTHALDAYCVRHGQPADRGSLRLHQPLECETLHAFAYKSCEAHALWRWARGFRFALQLYGSINVVMLMVPRRGSRFAQRLARLARSAVRSLAFLASYIALCWYGVCLARTRLLPRLFPAVPPTRWDNTVCAAAGSLLCGWSCLLETPRRRKELALFVAPRAVGTLVSFEPTAGNLQLESVAFAAGLAVLVAFSRREASKVRGVFGTGLSMVFSLA